MAMVRHAGRACSCDDRRAWAGRSIPALVATATLALLPKCPLCAMAYLGVGGVIFADRISLWVWAPYALAVSLWLVVSRILGAARKGKARSWRLGLALLSAFAISSDEWMDSRVLVWVGVFGLAIATLVGGQLRTRAESC